MLGAVAHCVSQRYVTFNNNKATITTAQYCSSYGNGNSWVNNDNLNMISKIYGLKISK